MRWIVLVSLIFAIFRAYRGWLSGKEFSSFDDGVRHWTATAVQIQFMLGLFLYFISPLIEYFFTHFGEAVKEREIRFFGMEHSLMMVIAVGVISTASSRAKRLSTAALKFKTVAIGYSLGLLIILTSIPWGIWILTSRPFFRPFF
jgi:hydrogenase/urease accessory protein HupE